MDDRRRVMLDESSGGGPGAIMPVRGQLITMNLGNGEKQYKVLNRNGTVVEALAMYLYNDQRMTFGANTTVSIAGGYRNKKYDGSNPDVCLNQTFYNSLSSEAKNAIQPTLIDQNAWFDTARGYPVYYGTKNAYNHSYVLSRTTVQPTSLYIGNKYIYILSIQDIVDYLSDSSVLIDTSCVLHRLNTLKMLWDTDAPVKSLQYVWLRSGYADSNGFDMYAFNANDGYIASQSAGNSYFVQPAFHIDLSKISWQ